MGGSHTRTETARLSPLMPWRPANISHAQKAGCGRSTLTLPTWVLVVDGRVSVPPTCLLAECGQCNPHSSLGQLYLLTECGQCNPRISMLQRPDRIRRINNNHSLFGRQVFPQLSTLYGCNMFHVFSLLLKNSAEHGFQGLGCDEDPGGLALIP